MFTGIVQGVGRVLHTQRDGERVRLRICLPENARQPIAVGASVSIAGVCLTFVEGTPEDAAFDVIDETLRLTTLGALQTGASVNVERAAAFGDEIGGHLLSGHVGGCASIVHRDAGDTHFSLRMRPPPALVPYIFSKGYIGVEGCSLTIGEDVESDGTFGVHLIPETLRVTTLGGLEVGDSVNLEVDAMTRAVVDTVKRVLADRSG